jgi:hypothetical protein
LKKIFSLSSVFIFGGINACVFLCCGIGSTNRFSPKKHKGADVYVNGVLLGVTPVRLQLKLNNSYTLEFKKVGFETKTVVLNDSVCTGWIVLDLADESENIMLDSATELRGLVPLVVDSTVGSRTSLNQRRVNQVLERQKPTLNNKNNYGYISKVATEKNVLNEKEKEAIEPELEDDSPPLKNLLKNIVFLFNDDGFMNLKFGDGMDAVKNKLASFGGIRFEKTIKNGLLFSGGTIEDNMVETWEVYFANNKFAGLRLCFIDTKLFSKLKKSITNKFGKYTNKEESGPVMYYTTMKDSSEDSKKMQDVILSWYLTNNAIELEEEIVGIGALGSKVFITYANVTLSRQLKR